MASSDITLKANDDNQTGIILIELKPCFFELS